MKVLYLIPQNKIGGAEVAFSSLNKLENGRIEVIKVDLGLITNNPLKYFKAILKVRGIIRSHAVDIIVSSLWKSHFVVMFGSIFLKVKLVPFIHSTRWFNVFDQLFSRIILNKSFAIIADSFSAYDWIKGAFPKKKVYIVSMKISQPDCYKKYIKRNNIIKFVFLGRLNSLKRIDKMYQFIEILSRSLPDNRIYLDLYGPLETDFKKEKKILENANKDLKVIYKGEIQRTGIQHTLLEYDYYLQLSDVEGMAMSVVEAMSIGLIPIVTSVGEISNYAMNMHNSILCSPADSISSLVNSFLILEKDIEKQRVVSKNAIKTFSNKPLFEEDFFNVLNNVY